jgi:hypothetical protein
VATSGAVSLTRNSHHVIQTLIGERGKRMFSVLIEFAVFFLLLFFLLPSLLIFLMIVREIILQARNPSGWQKNAGGDLLS